MLEYKRVRVSEGSFEASVNGLAREGWRVVHVQYAAVELHGSARVLLERESKAELPVLRAMPQPARNRFVQFSFFQGDRAVCEARFPVSDKLLINPWVDVLSVYPSVPGTYLMVRKDYGPGPIHVEAEQVTVEVRGE